MSHHPAPIKSSNLSLRRHSPAERAGQSELNRWADDEAGVCWKSVSQEEERFDDETRQSTTLKRLDALSETPLQGLTLAQVEQKTLSLKLTVALDGADANGVRSALRTEVFSPEARSLKTTMVYDWIQKNFELLRAHEWSLGRFRKTVGVLMGLPLYVMEEGAGGTEEVEVWLARWCFEAKASAEKQGLSLEAEALHELFEQMVQSKTSERGMSWAHVQKVAQTVQIWDEAQWLSVWRKLAFENGNYIENFNLIEALGWMSPSVAKQERNILFEEQDESSIWNQSQFERAKRWLPGMPLKKARKSLKLVIRSCGSNPVERLEEWLRIRPGLVRGREVGRLFGQWLQNYQEHFELFSWGELQKQRVEELARALEAAVPPGETVDWSAPALSYWEIPWALEGKKLSGKIGKGKCLVWGARTKGPRLTLPQWAWISNQTDLIEWLRARGAVFDAKAAQGVLEMLGEGGVAAEVASFAMTPLLEIVAKQERAELHALLEAKSVRTKEHSTGIAGVAGEPQADAEKNEKGGTSSTTLAASVSREDEAGEEGETGASSATSEKDDRKAQNPDPDQEKALQASKRRTGRL